MRRQSRRPDSNLWHNLNGRFNLLCRPEINFCFYDTELDLCTLRIEEDRGGGDRRLTLSGRVLVSVIVVRLLLEANKPLIRMFHYTLCPSMCVALHPLPNEGC